MRIRWAGIATTVALIIASAPHASAQVRYVDELFTGVDATTDVVYGQATNVDGDLQDLHLDMYEPSGDTASDRAVFVWAHGGYFTQGDKDNIGVIADHMTKRGWVTISVEYRLDPSLPEGFDGYLRSGDINALLHGLVAIRNAQHDIQAAIRWVRANAGTYDLDPNRIALGGHSAGATAAMNVAYNSDDPGSSGNPGYPSHVTAAIGTGAVNYPFFDVRIDPAVEPPAAMYHGLRDEIPFVAPKGVCLLAVAMLNHCEFHLYADEDHNSRVGMDDWLDFLYPVVIEGKDAPVRLPPGTFPAIPQLRFEPGSVPVPPVPLPV